METRQTMVEQLPEFERHLRFSRRTGLFLLLVSVAVLAGGVIFPGAGVDSAPGSLIGPIYISEMVAGFLVIILRRAVLSSFLLGKARQKGLLTVLRNLTIMSVFGVVVAVTMALTGLVVCRLTGDYQHLIRLGGMGLLLIFYSLPRRGEWRMAVAGLE